MLFATSSSDYSDHQRQLQAEIPRLDLTAASRVHLLEPQWSPMAEEQAFDRVHRMGQPRAVAITRYVMKDSIEEVTSPPYQQLMMNICIHTDSSTSYSYRGISLRSLHSLLPLASMAMKVLSSSR